MKDVIKAMEAEVEIEQALHIVGAETDRVAGYTRIKAERLGQRVGDLLGRFEVDLEVYGDGADALIAAMANKRRLVCTLTLEDGDGET